MGLILAGILAGVLFSGIAIWILSNCNSSMSDAPGLLLPIIFSVFLGIFVGINEPVSGYGEPEVSSIIELVSLRDVTVSEGKGIFYVSVSGTNSYTYYEEINSIYASDFQKAYKSNTISGSNVTIVEDDSYTKAKLVTYVRYGKKTFWTFAVGAEKYEYVFYVPTGTIARDVSLG